MRYQFDGEILGFATESGHRVVVGRWWSTPFGPFSDVMLEDESGFRQLIAPRPDVADFVAETYFFDEVVTTAVEVIAAGFQRHIRAGELDAEIMIGRRHWTGVLLRLAPRSLRTSPLWSTILDPVASRLLAGVHLHGRSRGGRREWYGAHDVHRLASARTSWNGASLGGMTDVVPPVRFGFGSVPKEPALVRVTTTVDIPSRGLERD
jgi:hypothetical protein